MIEPHPVLLRSRDDMCAAGCGKNSVCLRVRQQVPLCYVFAFAHQMPLNGKRLFRHRYTIRPWIYIVHDKVWLVTKNRLTERLQYRDTCGHDSELNCNEETGLLAVVFWKRKDQVENHWLSRMMTLEQRQKLHVQNTPRRMGGTDNRRGSLGKEWLVEQADTNNGVQDGINIRKSWGGIRSYEGRQCDGSCAWCRVQAVCLESCCKYDREERRYSRTWAIERFL